MTFRVSLSKLFNEHLAQIKELGDTVDYKRVAQIKRTVECENCNHPNVLYWHTDYIHTVGEHDKAKRKRATESGIDLSLPKHKFIRDIS